MASEHRLQENVRTLVPLSFLRLLKKIYRSLRVKKIFVTKKTSLSCIFFYKDTYTYRDIKHNKYIISSKYFSKIRYLGPRL